ncbi:acid beta-fructofuranosidase-like isoform X1 [Coffea arabica]|uniref:beta-fructofuranosidase n=2 Tax=Coffea arabica TaxID=13443 RepID=A0ABM4VAZ4_COFAR
MASSGWHEPSNPAPSPYAPLLGDDDQRSGAKAKCRRPTKFILLLVAGLLAVGLLVALVDRDGYAKKMSSSMPNDEATSTSSGLQSTPRPPEKVRPAVARGVAEGVSAKSNGPFLFAGEGTPFSWTNQMLAWQRTAFHFQPRMNWMNGPLLYKGWYHLFYQYNPDGAVWGNIVWGHAVSTDLIHWRHLPIAMVADQWYDQNGVWTGSATILPDGQLVMLYTGSTNATVQVQNLAYPADPSDPLLIEWVKYPGNPVLVPPPGIHFKDFRDPTTAWYTSEGKWRITIGSKVNKTGISLVYDTVDFKSYELLDGVLHGVPGTGMWECVDFYPVSRTDENGLDTSDDGSAVKHVVKASLDDDRNDYYALGTYDGVRGKWIPDDPTLDVGIGLRYDYGNFYASKTFYDQEKRRRVLWGWITETDSEAADIAKGWASLQAIPRTVLYDKKTGTNLLQWPVEEVEKLRLNGKSFDGVEVKPGSVIPLDVGSAAQLDVVAEFEIDKEAKEMVNGTDAEYVCSTSGGAAERGALGPFGLLVLADNDQSEQTPVYFYIAKGTDGNFKTFFCSDLSRSSKATDVRKGVYCSTVPVLEGEKLSMRILVDHSIVESFGQGGRTCITSRVYPTNSVYENAQLFLFNNATDAKVKASIRAWHMNSANIYPSNDSMNKFNFVVLKSCSAIFIVAILYGFFF